MNSRVVLASLASSEPMGQQLYENELADRLLMQAHDSSMRIARLRVSPWKAPEAQDVRAPIGLTARLPLVAQLAVGSVTYRGADLVHRLDLRLPPARREVVTVHDLAPLRFPDEGTIPAAVIRQLQRARAIICPSRFSAAEIEAVLGLKTAAVIHNGLPSDIASAGALEAHTREGLGLGRPYVVHAGGATRRKNLEELSRAWRELTTDPAWEFDLVLCGPDDVRRHEAFQGLTGVHLMGKLPRAVQLGVIKCASAAVVPSTYEGFGFPALEAMSLGVPVVAADCGALPEVCGDAALLVQPSAAGIAEGIRRVVFDQSLIGDLRQKGSQRAAQFSWEANALAHLRLYADALA